MYCLQREDGMFYQRGVYPNLHNWTSNFRQAYLFDSEKGADARKVHSRIENGEKCYVLEVICQLIEREDYEYPVNSVTEELADKYDGKCYVDYDRSEWIEAFRFFKDENGLNIHYIGASSTNTYNHIDHDDFGTEGVENSFCLTNINMVEDGSNLIKEITEDDFNKMNAIVESMSEKVKALDSELDNYKRTFDCYKQSCCKADVDLFEENNNN